MPATRKSVGAVQSMFRSMRKKAKQALWHWRHAGATPEVLYERQWSTGLLRRVMVRLAEVYEREGKADTFRALQAMIAGGQERGRYGELAAELKMSEASLRMMVFRMRKRYRTLLHDEIAQTVLDPAEVDDEINHLMNLYQND